MKFIISGTLLRYTDYEKSPEFDSDTVRQALNSLVERFPEMKMLLFDRFGNVRATHRLFLNNKLLTSDELEASTGDADCVEILTAVAGG